MTQALDLMLSKALATVGLLIVTCAIVWMNYALKFDTTLRDPTSDDRVFSQGLMNDRLVHTLAAGFTLVFGAVVVMIGLLLSVRV